MKQILFTTSRFIFQSVVALNKTLRRTMTPNVVKKPQKPLPPNTALINTAKKALKTKL